MTQYHQMIKLGVLAAALSIVSVARSQVTITADDMFNQAGQYYRAYINSGDTVVSGRLGKPGGPQAWDFTSGPTDEILRYDYMPVDQSPYAEAYPEATIVERKTNESDGSLAWLFFDQIAGRGRKVYGFFDPGFGLGSVPVVFDMPIFDFPEAIRMNDTWSTSLSFVSEFGFGDDTAVDPEDPFGGGGFFTVPIRITMSSVFKVDAYGIVNQPGVGFGDALRVNELQTVTTDVDLSGSGQFENVQTDFVRTYYWLRPGLGIAVQIISNQQSTPPGEDFSTAIAFTRTFETNHAKGGDRPVVNGLTGLKVTYNSGRLLLNWNVSPDVTSYSVEYTDDIGGSASWKVLGETSNNFMIDSGIDGSRARYYRIVGSN